MIYDSQMFFFDHQESVTLEVYRKNLALQTSPRLNVPTNNISSGIGSSRLGLISAHIERSKPDRNIKTL